MPRRIFYNTGIATYVWAISNRKEERRKGKIQMIDASGWSTPLRKNLGEKSVEISAVDFGYSKITIERPLRIAGLEAGRVYNVAEIKKLKEDGVRDELVPPIIKKVLPLAVTADPLYGRYRTVIDGKTRFVEYEPDAWIDETKTKIGYEISLTRHFYKPTTMRALAEIQAGIRALEAETDNLITEITGG